MALSLIYVGREKVGWVECHATVPVLLTVMKGIEWCSRLCAVNVDCMVFEFTYYSHGKTLLIRICGLSLILSLSTYIGMRITAV